MLGHADHIRLQSHPMPIHLHTCETVSEVIQGAKHRRTADPLLLMSLFCLANCSAYFQKHLVFQEGLLLSCVTADGAEAVMMMTKPGNMERR